MRVYNIGHRPEIIGITREGFPLVIQVGKSGNLPGKNVDKLLEQRKNLLKESDYKAFQEKKKKDKKKDK